MSSYMNCRLLSDQRQSFLVQWNNRYPMPSQEGVHGMVVFDGDTSWLERNGHSVAILDWAVVGPMRVGQGFSFDPQSVLQSGDWVECFGQWAEDRFYPERVQLLSPNLNDRGHRSDVKVPVRKWNNFIRRVKTFFLTEGFDELMTPTLVTCPGTEPFLDSFKTEFHCGSHRETLFLPTSPELHLKKCLAKGWDKIFEIRPCFRNGELTPIHQPEFYMLEWYRAFSSMEDLQTDIRNLVGAIVPDFLDRSWQTKTVAELFHEFLGFQLLPTSTADDLMEVATRHGLNVPALSDFDDIFFFLFVEKIEPFLGQYDCLFLHSYPPSQAALARLSPEGWGDRFEFYIDGVEIANAFNELNDPAIQRRRSQEDLDKKNQVGRPSVPLDEEFFRALEGGMPPSCGIALGLDRLFLTLFNYSDIRDFRLFPK